MFFEKDLRVLKLGMFFKSVKKMKHSKTDMKYVKVIVFWNYDFVFFINGQYMEHDAISIQQTGASLLLKVNNDSIGYDLETDDEILAIGKFNS